MAVAVPQTTIGSQRSEMPMSALARRFLDLRIPISFGLVLVMVIAAGGFALVAAYAAVLLLGP